MTRRPAPTRFARVVLLSVTSAALSVAAHGAAGGTVTEVLPALPLGVLVAFAGTAVVTRSRWATLLTLGVAQLGQHALLDLGYHAPHETPAVDPVVMTAAHVVAALLTGLLLTRADAALSVLVTALSRLVPVLFAPARAGSAPRVPLVSRASTPLAEVLLRRVNGRRGPPVLLINRNP